MKMKLLAIAVMATACGTNAFAAEVYRSGDTTLAIGGYVDVGVGEYDSSGEVKVHQVSPRINVAVFKTLAMALLSMQKVNGHLTT